ncbi:hypothetical protein CHS0354_017404 [Potamilus streckersoni]|uniref:Uncharacterized protein n=1 Tax=Potamilus streckersoni TaxID=2493646 RepID=A0AAE0SEG5_9BIVA|nr:hypothetical protein CHS0354_017404 [Potamilus streckersoni]
MLTKEGQQPVTPLHFTLLNLLLTAGPYATQENYEFQILQIHQTTKGSTDSLQSERKAIFKKDVL